MKPLSGKVLMPDGVNKVFNYADVKGAVEYLKDVLRTYWKHKLISRTSKEVNDLINASFPDVINNYGGELQ